MHDHTKLAARITSLEQLRELFSAMQVISAARLQGAQAALASIHTYVAVIGQAIGSASALQRPGCLAPEGGDGGRDTLLLIGSEHGFVGALNRLLVERAKREAMGETRVGVIGRRATAVAVELGIEPAWSLSMATQVDGILMSARRAASRLSDADGVRLIFARHRGRDTLNIEVRTALPPDPQIIDSRALGMPPMHHLDPRVLLRRLLDELLMAELTLAMMESFASESSARLQIMQGAGHNIRGKLDDLKRQAGQLRQEEITSELLDIVAGGDAVARTRADAS